MGLPNVKGKSSLLNMVFGTKFLESDGTNIFEGTCDI